MPHTSADFLKYIKKKNNISEFFCNVSKGTPLPIQRRECVPCIGKILPRST